MLGDRTWPAAGTAATCRRHVHTL